MKEKKNVRILLMSSWCHNIPELHDLRHFLESGVAVRKVGGRTVKVGVVIRSSPSQPDRWVCDS